ncbi:plasmid partitioning protein RepB [Sagittula stellata]|uniref:Rep B partitioning protein/ParB-like protein n=1 Tax=Sagittula stellata (strain ATCC 700073 / DSM 11524 / E-37) TaxID=388399 RepID=A3K4C1_SAGS3|nr:plasmid partitioning protein RepB [Sagittula stellata]EBA07820.1 Rep B partitioning protein/ParB-like protein [Sagittula stellata E-37]
MSDKKKSRLSMLDGLAQAGASAPPAPMMSSNRALRSARDAVDGINVWELDPDSIANRRVQDRMELGDVSDLRQNIETNGQTVPILVRRDPKDPEKYLLVYGARRLAAIRESDKVTKVRALVASMSDEAAMRAQMAENADRRDLTFIEKAFYAYQLIEVGFGTQSEVAEMLNVTKSWISMSQNIMRLLGPELVQIIGPAPGVGRPRWDALAQALDGRFNSRAPVIEAAEDAASRIASDEAAGKTLAKEPSVLIFEALERLARGPKRKPIVPVKTTLKINGEKAGSLARTAKGVAIDLDDPRFANWMQNHAEPILEELYARWREDIE